MRIFLGGTCNGSTWRDNLILLFDKFNIGYFNPIVNNWTQKAQENELIERKKCDICLYTITPKITGVYSIAEVVDDSNKRPEKTVLIILKNYDGLSFDNQWMSLTAVARLVKANGAPVYTSLKDYVETLSSVR